jgi:hypothetical protein
MPRRLGLAFGGQDQLQIAAPDWDFKVPRRGAGGRMVELRGIEPLTSSLRTRRSPS